MKPVILSIIMLVVAITAVPAYAEDIPAWIKTIILYWGDGLIGDEEFKGALAYLIEQDIIQIKDAPQITPEDAAQNPTAGWHHDHSRNMASVITWDIATPSDPRIDMNHEYSITYIPPANTAVPSGPHDEARVIAAIGRGFEIWEEQNAMLDFERDVGGDADILVKWEMEPSPSHIGLAEYTARYGGVITVHVGDFDCNLAYVEWSSNVLIDTTMHEIGHILGLDHHTDENHLMYGDDEFTVMDFDALGYNIPDSMHLEYYVGQEQLDKKIDGMDGEMEMVDMQMDGVYGEMEVVDAEFVTALSSFGITREDYESGRYNNSASLYHTINPIVDNYNVLVDQYNVLRDQYNALVDRQNLLIDEYNCYPNIESD